MEQVALGLESIPSGLVQVEEEVGAFGELGVAYVLPEVAAYTKGGCSTGPPSATRSGR